MTRKPEITVLMPVYNAEPYLQQAVESILNQTFVDFEFVIVDDGSTDNSYNLIRAYNDPRIILIQNKQNIGITESLNTGLERAEGEYIARMDADDVSLPNRFELQLKFMKNNRDIALLGTWGMILREDGSLFREIHNPANPWLLKWRLLFNNQIIHSSVMFDTKKVRELGGYQWSNAEDYYLWSRIISKYPAANLEKILVYWRYTGKGFDARNSANQDQAVTRIAQMNIQNILERDVSYDVVRDIRTILNHKSIPSSPILINISDTLHEIYCAVIRQWSLNHRHRKLIASEYSDTIQLIASLNANLRRKNSFTILRKALKANHYVLFKASFWKCVLKIFMGPFLLSKCQIALGKRVLYR